LHGFNGMTVSLTNGADGWDRCQSKEAKSIRIALMWWPLHDKV
jgi:hypothetical protein